MTRTISSGYSVVRLDGGQGQVGLSEKGVIIATGENRVAEWLKELLLPCMRRVHVLRYAATTKEFDLLVRMPRMAIAFIEVGFFGEAMIGCLDRLHKQFPQLRIVLFTVSFIQPDEATRYVYWSGGSFISLRDRQERIKERLEAIFEGRKQMLDDILLSMGDYDRLTGIPPHLTHQEIEIVRYIAQEKTDKEMTHCLKVSIRTLNYHLGNIYRKFGIRNRVGILKLAVTQGILPEKELRSCHYRH
jgi:DNA-binding CsgD family transcriptional regulator